MAIHILVVPAVLGGIWAAQTAKSFFIDGEPLSSAVKKGVETSCEAVSYVVKSIPLDSDISVDNGQVAYHNHYADA